MNSVIKGFGVGVVLGLAAVAAWSVVGPTLAVAGRPLAKALVKHTLLGIDRLKVSIARASESAEDFVAEVRSEVERELSQRPMPGPEHAQSVADAVQAPDLQTRDKVYS
jgi:hypothetical protein